MFTGIIQHCATVRNVSLTEAGAQLVLDASGWSHVPSHGDSIAVNGCCLTVGAARDGELMFDVIHQTLRHTTLGDLRAADRVNVEHAATPSTLLGGHIVQGHVDGVGTVRGIVKEGGEHRIRLEPPTELMDYIIMRGSIALDGVSLTLATVGDSTFEVALIPTTLELTTLGKLREGSRVNLEADYLAKVAIEWIRRLEVSGQKPAIRSQKSARLRSPSER